MTGDRGETKGRRPAVSFSKRELVSKATDYCKRREMIGSPARSTSGLRREGTAYGMEADENGEGGGISTGGRGGGEEMLTTCGGPARGRGEKRTRRDETRTKTRWTRSAVWQQSYYTGEADRQAETCKRRRGEGRQKKKRPLVSGQGSEGSSHGIRSAGHSEQAASACARARRAVGSAVSCLVGGMREPVGSESPSIASGPEW